LLFWCGAAAVAVAFVLFGLRTRWITPVPGVRVEMTRPHVTEADLGPDSAYRLLLATLAQIAKAEVADPDPNIRGSLPGLHDKLGIDTVQPETPKEPEGDIRFPSLEEAEQAEESEQEPVRVWGWSWTDALTKFTCHPWPTSPPPAAPLPDPKPSPFLGDPFATMEPDAHDLAIVAKAPWTLEQYEEILHGIALVRPALPALDRALAAPDPQMPTVESFLQEEPHTGWVLRLCQWLSISAYLHEAEGDYAAAFRDVERILQTGALLSRGGYWPGHMTNLSCSLHAMNTARAIAMRHSLEPGTLKQAAESFLRVADESEPYVEFVRADFVPLRNFVAEYYRRSILDLNASFDYPYVSESRRKRFVNNLAFSAARLAGSTPSRTRRNIESLCQHLVVLAEKPYSVAVQDEYDDLLGHWCPKRSATAQVLGTWDPVGYHLVGWTHTSGDWMHPRITAYVAQLRSMALFLAVRAYEVDHARLPEKLDELTPSYISRLPDDPFSGKPFGYLRRGVPGLPTEAWAIYSVGGNCVDDGGTAYYTLTARPFTSPDLVIPSQDYPDAWVQGKPRREWHTNSRKWSRFGEPESSL
jgi:hypothetical protein